MTGYRVREQGSEVEIELTGVEGRQDELLGAFGECQSGRCSCPTDEYEKVLVMQIEPHVEQITIHLEPIEGERFDIGKIAACLEHTIAKTENDRPA